MNAHENTVSQLDFSAVSLLDLVYNGVPDPSSAPVIEAHVSGDVGPVVALGMVTLQRTGANVQKTAFKTYQSSTRYT